ncbi:hypothetical protein JCM11641_002956 [Rhodosporidiobolus odoratus]
MPAKILFVLSSHDQLLNGTPTGWFLPEAAHPYYALEKDYEIVFASPKGSKAPIDPASIDSYKEDEECVKFLADESTKKKVENTLKLEDVSVQDYVAIFYVGGQAPCFDLPHDKTSHKLIQDFWKADKVVSAVCHGPVAFSFVPDPVNPEDKLVKGKKLTVFSNEEENGYRGPDVIPFLAETALRDAGAKLVIEREAWGVEVVVDGKLVTGGNPASARATGEAVLKVLKEGKA